MGCNPTNIVVCWTPQEGRFDGRVILHSQVPANRLPFVVISIESIWPNRRIGNVIGTSEAN